MKNFKKFIFICSLSLTCNFVLAMDHHQQSGEQKIFNQQSIFNPHAMLFKATQQAQASKQQTQNSNLEQEQQRRSEKTLSPKITVEPEAESNIIILEQKNPARESINLEQKKVQVDFSQSANISKRQSTPNLNDTEESSAVKPRPASAMPSVKQTEQKAPEEPKVEIPLAPDLTTSTPIKPKITADELISAKKNLKKTGRADEPEIQQIKDTEERVVSSEIKPSSVEKETGDKIAAEKETSSWFTKKKIAGGLVAGAAAGTLGVAATAAVGGGSLGVILTAPDEEATQQEAQLMETEQPTGFEGFE